jgi:hypothetical protein
MGPLATMLDGAHNKQGAKMKKTTLSIVLSLLLLSLMTTMVMGEYPKVRPAGVDFGIGAPIIDGDPSEWEAADYFAPIYEGANPEDRTDPIHAADLYLRYDCDEHVLYMLVLTLSPYTLDTTDYGEEIWFYIEGIQPDDKLQWPEWAPKQWVPPNEGEDPLGTKTGFEAAVDLDVWYPEGVPETFTQARWHILFGSTVEGEEAADRTGATEPLELKLKCDVPVTAITLMSFGAQPAAGQVTVSWETGTELDNAGFYLYRASSAAGPYAQVNAALIPAHGDAVAGGSYSYVDEPGYGTFYYKLADVSLSGVVTFREAISVDAASPFRLPLCRPAIPR